MSNNHKDQTALSCAKHCHSLREHYINVQRKLDCQCSRSYLDTIDTCQTRINLSVYPANRVCPSADHASDRQTGALLVLPITSGFSSSTTILPSRSCNIVHGPHRLSLTNTTKFLKLSAYHHMVKMQNLIMQLLFGLLAYNSTFNTMCTKAQIVSNGHAV